MSNLNTELSPENIIVRMPNWLGDLVMATPILEELRKKFPQAKITAMCQANTAPLLENNPYINEIFSYNRPSGWIHRSQHTVIIDSLKKGKYDLGILLTNSFSSAWWFWRGDVKNRIGFKGNLRSCLLDYPISFPANLENQHLVKTYKQLLTPLGVTSSYSVPKLFLSENEKEAAWQLLQKQNIEKFKHVIIGINPGAAYGSAKCWPPERFKEITQRLLNNPEYRILYFGDNKGSPLVQEICQEFPQNVINLAGKTNIRELMALIHCCNAILTNDSGPMHIASALHVPLVALFGSTNDTKTGPLDGTVIHKHVKCSPCYKRVCPIDFKCMKQISVDEVYSEIEKILQKNQKN